MDWGQTLHGIDLDNDGSLRHEVDPVATIQFDLLIDQRKRFLLLDAQPAFPKFISKACLVG